MIKKLKIMNNIKGLFILGLAAVSASTFSGCVNITPDCGRILSVSDNYGCEVLGEYMKISVAFTFLSFNREIVNEAVRELKDNPNRSLLIECKGIWSNPLALKYYLTNLGVDSGRIRKLPDSCVLVMSSNISLEERDDNRYTWVPEEPVVCTKTTTTYVDVIDF